ncbi:uncharacterized protein K460DRAFT_364934 [Cucurbitaria berberidis CBS 394.84]|uniref:Uncharacterized protein n=1 Tax=Cucurbitaria berberidis CBS 394.84 TaxID=1168544 RepID=A0A9P4GMA6_9PLEO|nr:uncharacterized protein K460DRAFT_364934 [Cucurbitaria berberidis CBS 394.84]KAF1849013.1 hypothetical protein K460DRAFT_364934 [Cucurbitaria berberidis CBS 394.84]
MPTHTPSPHRFLAPNPLGSQTSKPKPPSNLRNVLASQTPKPTVATRQKPELQFKKLTPAKRFVITPARPTPRAENLSTGKEGGNTAWKDTRTELTPRSKPRRKFERVESIQESSQSSATATQADGDRECVVQPVEDHGMDSSDDAKFEEEMLFESVGRKKRRLTSPPSSPSRSQVSEPHTPLPARNPTTHRFKAPVTHTPADLRTSHTDIYASTPSGPSITSAPHKPQFLLPALPTSPLKPSKPLPEIFSPSRKNGKYVPNGLASTVTGWVIETANTGFAAQDRSTGITWGRDREDGVRLKVRIKHVSTGIVETEKRLEAECFAGGVIFVRGDTEPGSYNTSRAPSPIGDDGVLKVLLAGNGGARGAGGVRIKVGGIVGIRAPTWEVDVSGEKWLVGVDWVVL